MANFPANSQMSDGQTVSATTGTQIRVTASVYSPGGYPEGLKTVVSTIIPERLEHLDPQELTQQLEQTLASVLQQFGQQLWQQVQQGRQKTQQLQQQQKQYSGGDSGSQSFHEQMRGRQSINIGG